jgi:hypothetical protein
MADAGGVGGQAVPRRFALAEARPTDDLEGQRDGGVAPAGAMNAVPDCE